MANLNPIHYLAGVAKALGARLAFFRAHRETLTQTAATAKIDTRKWSPELLKQLEWRRFEELCAAYYEALGFTTSISEGSTGGVDILLHEKGRPSALVRCRAWDAYRVGSKSVRELRIAMTATKVSEGVLLTSGRFTQEAVNLAAQEGIKTIDGAALLDKLAALPPEKALGLLKFATQGDFLTPTCPCCSIKMTSRQSTRQGRKFWGCRNYPACKQTFAGTAYAPA
ncbi:MAG TPA: restriction endonuclease [Burkholderiales bacterium]|nr:restriction endonuclease [Burkholderiales bacterium]